MNKLFIIGNGFDLAHGLKTNYQHFILWYFNQAIEKFNADNAYDDGFIKGFKIQSKPISKFENIDALIQVLANNRIRTFNLTNPWAKNLINNLKDGGWVDFEIIYYEILKEIVNEPSYSRGDKVGSIKQINKIFEVFKMKLQEYLNQIDLSITNIVGLPFYQKISEYAANDRNKYNALVINFNYTNIIDRVLSASFPSNPTQYYNFSKRIHIHGQLNSSSNPIIFGYGDELDEAYKSLEILNNNDALKFMKSFGYFRNSNYKNLDQFMNGDFDVHIVGHSCGLSDRLLLNEIFERDQCKNIYFHYWKKSASENNYIDITMNISRCFNDKTLMRKKVRSFEECVPFVID